MACGTAFDLDRSMFVNERALLIRMTTNARSIGADRKLRLFRLKSAVRVVTVAAVHRAFHDLMVERFAELGFRVGMAAHAELCFTRF